MDDRSWRARILKYTGVNPTTELGIVDWQLTVLQLPKRFARGKALGFCQGWPVGQAETSRAKVAATWWPQGKPELLTLNGYKEVRASSAHGAVIAGGWQKDQGEHRGAAAWTWADNQLRGLDLHDPRFDRTWARAAAGDWIIGSGVPPRVAGVRTRNVGLVWRLGEAAHILADPETEVAIHCTDGVSVGGGRDGRATWWPSLEAEPVDLESPGWSGSTLFALDGEAQYGSAFRGGRARAARWAGGPETLVDFTPEGVETATILGACQGFQVGSLRTRYACQGGSPGCDERAVVWRGGADRWFDLNSLLGEPYNSSIAYAVERFGSEIRICGEVRRCEVSNPNTKQESHFIPRANPAVWTGRLA